MTAATSGFGTLLKAGDAASPEVFTTIAEVTNIAGPTLSTEMIDVTNHSSASNFREKIASLKDGGEVTFSINYLPANATRVMVFRVTEPADIKYLRQSVTDKARELPGLPGFHALDWTEGEAEIKKSPFL